ncbi:hypothetical protein AVEN_183600-1 [Araneus ventricosus]|uniref:Uncharacterized protein n=1 Tax=Araneus ventricosus TaxID=182803 RepID=A0A4Y2G904_ARAVE|nr:hypothetical protein AVEN_227-1 [Araneus ventricosus]GBM50050.1 hypothetical protein AVEN_272206-1 [Araneus ventricosus]GBM50083.1 hypothetical protein AVEN_144503-1 [Araneus ventricosus]GBM50091.1 hypothetical protein AVEN_183600-1 [Araneus ventricosus]
MRLDAFSIRYCYEHGMSLPGNVSLTVGKIVLQGLVWNARQRPGLDPSPWRPFCDIIDDTSDKLKIPENAILFLISRLGEEIRLNVLDNSM